MKLIMIDEYKFRTAFSHRIAPHYCFEASEVDNILEECKIFSEKSEKKRTLQELLVVFQNENDTLRKSYLELEKLSSRRIKQIELTRNLLGSCLILLALAASFSPVPVRIGDVCLSCWGGW